MVWPSILSVSQSKNSQNTVWIFLLELLQRLHSSKNSIIHQSWSSRSSFWHKSVEIVNSFSKTTLVVNNIVKEEQRNNMLEVVSNSSVSKSLKEWFDSSYSLQIWFIKESTSHGSWNIEQHCNCFLWISGNHRFEVFLIDNFLNILTTHISRHKI